jgi:hypothetical protein
MGSIQRSSILTVTAWFDMLTMINKNPFIPSTVRPELVEG